MPRRIYKTPELNSCLAHSESVICRLDQWTWLQRYNHKIPVYRLSKICGRDRSRTQLNAVFETSPLWRQDGATL